ncbi:hypothetical protein Tco_0140495 [Tanacetum coccineum]
MRVISVPPSLPIASTERHISVSTRFYNKHYQALLTVHSTTHLESTHSVEISLLSVSISTPTILAHLHTATTYISRTYVTLDSLSQLESHFFCLLLRTLDDSILHRITGSTDFERSHEDTDDIRTLMSSFTCILWISRVELHYRGNSVIHEVGEWSEDTTWEFVYISEIEDLERLDRRVISVCCGLDMYNCSISGSNASILGQVSVRDRECARGDRRGEASLGSRDEMRWRGTGAGDRELWGSECSVMLICSRQADCITMCIWGGLCTRSVIMRGYDQMVGITTGQDCGITIYGGEDENDVGSGGSRERGIERESGVSIVCDVIEVELSVGDHDRCVIIDSYSDVVIEGSTVVDLGGNDLVLGGSDMCNRIVRLISRVWTLRLVRDGVGGCTERRTAHTTYIGDGASLEVRE